MIRLDKEILIQYCEMAGEIKDIRRRIQNLKSEKRKIGMVADTVRGTRRDGTYGPIRIEGYPFPEEDKKNLAIQAYESLLKVKEAELLELMCQAEEYIESLEKSELRTMFRLYYIDNLPWWKVAQAMNQLYPKRPVRFTEDSCKKRNLRFFENVPQCPDEIV